MTYIRFVPLLLCLLFCFNKSLSAQSAVAQDLLLREPKQTGEIYTIVEKQPTFPDGQDALQQYLKQHRRYPEAAKKAGISGRVIVAFVVNTDGSIQDVSILKGLGMGCDEEAIRVKYNLPIAFDLAN